MEKKLWDNMASDDGTDATETESDEAKMTCARRLILLCFEVGGHGIVK